MWSYPQRDGDEEETIYNMVNTLLLRIHQSGHLAELSDERKQLVKEGIDYYKGIRGDIKAALPVWPIGYADNLDMWLVFALKTKDKAYMAVWRRGGEEEREIPLEGIFEGQKPEGVLLAYPKESMKQNCIWEYREDEGILRIKYKQPVMARMFEIVR